MPPPHAPAPRSAGSLPAGLIDAFPLDAAPFDRLEPAQRLVLLDSLDLGVYGAGEVLLQRDEPADALFVVLRGLVHERHGGEVAATHGPGGVFDLRALFTGGQTHSFVAAADTLCALVPRETLEALARSNPDFADRVHRDFADRLRALADERANRELTALTMLRIRQAYVHPPVFVDASASLRDAARAMRDRRATAVLVRDGERTGILTGTDLRDLVVLDGRPVSEPVGPLARYSLITLDADDPLFNALLLMTKHSVRRIVVTEQGAVTGVLEQIDLLGALSNHSRVVALRAERADDPEDLARASHDTIGLIRTLHATGVKVPFIADLVTELNRKIFRRLFELLAPPDLLANACLIVMGSEGRGEQLLKTDQDNGLILRDGYTCPDLERITAEFTRHLVAFGYPPCPGDIMVSNPAWARPLSGYKESVFRWIHRPDESAPLNLAIFYDAQAVAGDAALLDEARRYLLDHVQDNQGFFFQFARPVLAFDTPTGLFGGLFERRGGQTLDIKKAGIFPLVHGVRALALEKHLGETNTLARIWALADRGALDRPFAAELAETFTVLSTLRLKARIDTEQGGPGGAIDNTVRTAEMSRLDRDRFNDCLAVVKSFKQFISHHFHLNLH
ncbi:DUF294 nucleotidyltransferase-like domain-containing protein [Azospirillum halopraeferens]|uniref:DUF294 nucleotidyltransferase-like domain-containing protein n=1 Tax=Azospirillum halopraeferens TaxID=34010 RepID=UPI0004115F60|nr:DUF294 nucleotidyltransferase-like domain-containing protein [Azospirillum halopraeferens]